MNSQTTLGEFINQEMRKRDMSVREFADFIGVTHPTILKFRDHGQTEHVGNPSIDFLIKLARQTNTNLTVLLALAFPDAASLLNVDPSTLILSQRIQQLPDHIRQAIDDLINKYAP
jgi:transcriptional regulator with XRE-family HTH domain